MSPTGPSGELERLLSLVSPRVGIVIDLTEYERSPLEPAPPFIYQATLSNFDFRALDISDRATAGKGETPGQAMTGALGEAIERYCAAQFDRDASITANVSGCRAEMFTPADLVLYSERQYAIPNFPYTRFDVNAPIRWVRGIALSGGNEALAPASMAYLSADVQRDGEYFCPVTSSGLAAGADIDSAVLAGLCEIVERDAVLVTWMNRLPAPSVDYAACDLARSVSAHYALSGRELHVFNITTNISIPAMMALIVNRTGSGLAAAVGLGCHPDPTIALKKAVFEACQVHASESARMARERLTDTSAGYEQVRTLWDHSGFFSHTGRLCEFDFLLTNGRKQNLATIPGLAGSTQAALRSCVDLLERAGSRSMYVDLTTPDIAELGFRVVRVLATGLQPMHFGFGEERFGGRRLFAIAQAMGYDTRLRTEADLNPCPHPFG